MSRLLDRPWKKAVLVIALAAAGSLPVYLLLRAPAPFHPRREAAFVGGTNCIGCHQREFQLWKGSNHDRAMQVASDSTVLGDFHDAEFPFEGNVHRFYRRDGKFFVHTEGPDGRMKEFQVAYTFGVRPLQQYLVPFEDGKLQCLPIAWDTGRKRWFQMAAMVYDTKSRSPGNWLYWTNQAQNWNGMCAECHSTNLRKNFDPVAKSFATTWSDIDVNCEACHGPGSGHLEWAAADSRDTSIATHRGFIQPITDLPPKKLVEVCAPCHSRRSSLGPYDYEHPDFLSNAIPELPSPPHYYVDGQIREEDYEYASFTQSKMYMNRVRCTDCHNPHSLRLKFEGNALCGQCHKPEKFDTPAHHFHKMKGEAGNAVLRKNGERVEAGEGSLCVNCHMVGQYYMGIHFRRDHSFRIPRPDLTVTTGAPNACNDCHGDKTPQWSDGYINKWYGERRPPHVATIFAAAARDGTDTALINVILNPRFPEIVRATAIEHLAARRDTSGLSILSVSMRDPEPIIRYNAVRHFVANDAGELLTTLAPMLSDPAKAVRIEAANRLSVLKKEQFNESQYHVFASALREYESALNYAADFPAGRFNLAKHFEDMGDVRSAEENYLEALALDSMLYPAKVNLAFLYYNEHRMDRAESLFVDVSANYPGYPDADYNLGLLYGEQGRTGEAVKRLESAASKHGSPKVYYNLALLYERMKDAKKSEAVLLKSLAIDPGDYRTLYAICNLYITTKQFAKAETYARELQSRFPGDADAQTIVSYLRQRSAP